MFIIVHLKRFKFFLVMAFIITAIFICSKSVAVFAVKPASHDGIPLPVIMYHSMLKQSTGKNKYIVTPKEFESDLKYLQSAGYTTIFVQDLLNYVQKGTPLPQKPILLTFDDGYYNNYLYAYPLAKKYNSKIIISPIGYVTDLYSQKDANHATYSYITWDQMKEMIDSGNVEIQNHTYNLHESKGKRLGIKQLRGENEEDYDNLLKNDISKMQIKIVEHTGWKPTAFVYPFGVVSSASVPVIKELGFTASFTCAGKMNYISKDPECLYNLGRYLRPPAKSSSQFFSKILPKTDK